MKPNRNKPPQPKAENLVYQPFRGLKQAAAARPKAPPPAAKKPLPPPAKAPAKADDATLFLREMAGVTRLDGDSRGRVEKPAPASPPRESLSDEAEALAELCDLVNGQVQFDFEQTDEYVEGAVLGLDPRLLRRLRNGEFAYQDHVDLHGLSSEQARVEVDGFLMRAHRTNKRCVLIVHGRGLNSKDQVPVLKTRLTTWLTRGEWGRRVLAFSSARPCDGGVGALYVLLRRDRSPNRGMRVTNGAKW